MLVNLNFKVKKLVMCKTQFKFKAYFKDKILKKVLMCLNLI